MALGIGTGVGVVLGRPTMAHAQVGPAGGDLTGFYPNPQIAPQVITDSHVAVNAGIAPSKILNLVATLASKANDADVVHLAGAEVVAGRKVFGAGLNAVAASVSDIPVVVKGIAAQESDHQQWQLPDGRSFAAIRNRQLITSEVNDDAHEIGRGTLELVDFIAGRRLELGFYRYGSGIFTTGSSTEPFEFWVHSGVLSLRNNMAPPPASHRFEVRVPDDGPGINLEAGRKNGDVTKQFGGHIYFDTPGAPLYISSADGGGFYLHDGGIVRFGGQMVPSDANLSVGVLAPSSTKHAEVGFGWWNGLFDAMPWRLRLRPGGRKLGMIYLLSNQEDLTRSFYWTDDGRIGSGTDAPLARLDMRCREPTVPGVILRGATGHTANLQEWRGADGSLGMAVDRLNRLRWPSTLEQATVGASGLAATLPAKPSKYLRVVDATGTVLVVPAYTAT